MLGAEKSTELGCDTGDIACLCTNKNFIYGLRDCSGAICSESEASQVVKYGIAICSSKTPALPSNVTMPHD